VILSCVFLLSDEDMVLLDVDFLNIVSGSPSWLVLAVLIPLTFSRLPWWWPRQLTDTPFQISGETALAHSMVRWLA
jgi:hypothetical protein